MEPGISYRKFCFISFFSLKGIVGLQTEYGTLHIKVHTPILGEWTTVLLLWSKDKKDVYGPLNSYT